MGYSKAFVKNRDSFAYKRNWLNQRCLLLIDLVCVCFFFFLVLPFVAPSSLRGYRYSADFLPITNTNPFKVEVAYGVVWM